MQGNTGNTRTWHVDRWGVWGWIETVLKLIGLGAGLLAFFGSLSTTAGFMLGDNPNLAAVIVLALLTVASLGVLFVRYQQREVISMAFAVAQVLGHVGLLVALLRQPEQTTFAVIFGVFMVLGQLAKMVFLRVTGFTEAGQTPQAMQIATGVLAAFYALFTALIVL